MVVVGVKRLRLTFFYGWVNSYYIVVFIYLSYYIFGRVEKALKMSLFTYVLIMY